jgi:hypothetical protein
MVTPDEFPSCVLLGLIAIVPTARTGKNWPIAERTTSTMTKIASKLREGGWIIVLPR